MDIKKKLAIKIRKLRQAKGLSQEAFARECGVHRTYMGLIERGLTNITVDNLQKVADALNIEISELFI